MTRFGFGEQTGETEKGGLAQYENGFVEVSGTAFKWASSQYPMVPPAGAIGLAMADLANVDLADHVEAPDPEPVEIDYEGLQQDLQDLDGVGEATAEAALEAVRGRLQPADGA